MDRLTASISAIPGIGPKKKEALESLGIFTVQDALRYAPFRYEDRRERKRIADLSDGEKTAVLAVPAGTMSVRRDGGRTLYTQSFRDGSGLLRVTWQNSPYLTRSFRPGVPVLLYGRAFVKGNLRSMFSPLFEPAGAKSKKLGKIVPVYPGGAKVSQSLLSSATEGALSFLPPAMPDLLPEETRLLAGIPDWGTALRFLHRPATMEEANAGLRRLKFEELFLLFTGMQMQKKSLSEKKGIPLSASIEPFLLALPFTLTEAQRRAIEDIRQDMGSGHVMNRLIEGDVGSGKTAVAAAALYIAATEGKQGILLAPTTLLARQHAASLKKLLPGVEICLLTGKMRAAERREAEEAIQSGKAKVIVGTHAVLSESLPLSHVALVIVDEQHRFGVRQRGFLSSLPQSPHVLVMSATPIPRTLSLTFYGDLDISVLSAGPTGRKPVQTLVVPPSYRERIYGFIKKELAKGNKAYILCPLAEAGEEESLCDVETYAASLSPRFAPGEVHMLHGKMKEKEKVMEAFAEGAPSVLVSTTVIEVGMDVPSATVMVIENAERFGLSQLHQLRGRVGRGTEASYCILISEPRTREAQDRLDTMKRVHNGFEIAEADLRLRGPGEVFGVRQHGDLQLLYADILEDSHLLPLAAEGASRLLAKDPSLQNHPMVREAVGALYDRFAMN